MESLIMKEEFDETYEKDILPVSLERQKLSDEVPTKEDIEEIVFKDEPLLMPEEPQQLPACDQPVVLLHRLAESQCAEITSSSSSRKSVNNVIQRRKVSYFHECLLCGKTLFGLRNHYRNVHKLKKVLVNNLMSYSRGNPHKPVKQMFSCLVPNCGMKVTRLDKHMKNAHNFNTKRIGSAQTTSGNTSAIETLSTPQSLSYKHSKQSQKYLENKINLSVSYKKELTKKIFSSIAYQKFMVMMKTIDLAEQAILLNRSDNVLILAYILSLITIGFSKAAHRLCNITLCEYKNRVLEKEQCIIKAAQHRPSSKCESKIVPLTKTQDRWVAIYLEKIRPCITPSKGNKNYLFLKANGEKVQCSDIRKYLNMVCNKSSFSITQRKLLDRSIECESHHEACNVDYVAEEDLRLPNQRRNEEILNTFADAIMLENRGSPAHLNEVPENILDVESNQNVASIKVVAVSGSVAIQGGKPRYIRECLVCGKRTIDIRKHFSNFHKFEKPQINEIMASFRGNPDKPIKNKLFACLMPNCGARVTRLDQHMKRVHHGRPTAQDNDSPAPVDLVPAAAAQSVSPAPVEPVPAAAQSIEPPLAFCEPGTSSECASDTASNSFQVKLKDAIENMRGWMLGSDGGQKNIHNARQKENQMSYLCSKANIKDKQELLSCDVFWPIIQENVRSSLWRPDTGSFYLRALKDFYEYVLKNNLFDFSEEEKLKVHQLMFKIPVWISTLKPLGSSHKFQMYEIMMSQTRNEDILKKVLSSEAYKKTVDIIEKIEASKLCIHLTRSNYVSVMAYILVLIIIRSPKSTKMLRDVTLSDYSKRTLIGGQYLIKVPSKSSRLRPSVISVPETQDRWITIYLEKIRPTLSISKGHENILFLRFDGIKLPYITLTRYINSVCKNAGLCSTYTQTKLVDSAREQNVTDYANMADNIVPTTDDHFSLHSQERNKESWKAFLDAMKMGNASSTPIKIKKKLRLAEERKDRNVKICLKLQTISLLLLHQRLNLHGAA